MKKIFVAAALTLFSAGLAFAADEIVLPAKNGDVTFTHKKHQERLKDCKICHKKGPGKIEGFKTDIDSSVAHGLCRKCHQEKGAGPTKCNQCHKK